MVLPERWHWELQMKKLNSLFVLAMMLSLLSLSIFVAILNFDLLKTNAVGSNHNLEQELQELNGKCFIFHQPSFWWTYKWCHRDSIVQYHVDESTGEVEDGFWIGYFNLKKTQRSKTGFDVFAGGDQCKPKSGSKSGKPRSAEVEFMCCSNTVGSGTYIKRVREKGKCEYLVRVCTEYVCPVHTQVSNESKSDNYQTTRKSTTSSKTKAEESYSESKQSKSSSKRSSTKLRRFSTKQKDRYDRVMTDDEIEQSKEDVKALFYHAYDGYMSNGFPHGEVLPKSCQGTAFDLCKLPMVTLIDTLDTLVILGNDTEFERAVWLVADHADFALDLNVSVFETNIRVLGGLLSAHVFANSHIEFQSEREYAGELLNLAVDIGERLLPAFDTRTGIPYGTVNLLSGVPPEETPIASTAGGGSLSLEFSILSALTGNASFGDAATRAVRELYNRKSRLHLLGKHIDVRSGRWTEGLSGIGSNSDSFYEYLIKMYCMFGDEEYYQMFLTTYGAIERYNRVGDWYNDVDMNTGAVRRRRFENLMAFWPGMQLLVGDINPATKTLNAMYKVWRNHGFIPEQFDFVKWELVMGGTSHTYPLRPELIESTMLMYEATKDKSWLWAGRDFLDSLEYARVDCGFATVNVDTLGLQDAMPSFFLAETAKYLYLLFDRDNFIHQQPYIFSTEAHPFLVTDFLPDKRQQCMVPSYLPFDVEEDKSVEQIDKATKKSKKSKTTASPSTEESDENHKPEQKFNIDVHALWEHEEFLRNQQCPPISFWDEYQYFTHYSDSKTGHRGVDYGSDKTQHSVCPGHTYGLPDLSVHKPDETLLFDFGPDLGIFKITASSLGFSVISDKTGEIMNIALLGKGLLFIQDHAEEAQGAVIADRQSNSVYCQVDVIIEQEDGQEDSQFPQFTFPCSVAAFGPTRDLDEVGPITAELVLPTSNPELCTSSKDDIRDRIVLVDRGTCMFESKTLVAQEQGAAAVIVANTEADGDIFVMAGIETASGISSGKSRTTIPTVMLSKENAKYLRRITDKFHKKGKQIQIEITVVKKKIQTLDEFIEAMDVNLHFPQVFAANPNTIYVMSQGIWGTMLVTKTGVDWQLVVVEKESFFAPEDESADDASADDASADEEDEVKSENNSINDREKTDMDGHEQRFFPDNDEDP
mmetsp:Transcript_38000/g.50045  ORF Transcript_38000/g.50045 Transcript_38000/m.50045 type:complete len:1155 (-) Transcript_38000:35-3499(-)